MRKNDTGGGMPFAIIAVTILLVSAAGAAVAAGYQRGEDGADGASDGIEAVDDAILDITSHVNRGLGNLVYDTSVKDSASLGFRESMLPPDEGEYVPPSELEKRTAAFLHMADAWLKDQFPIVSGGTRAEYLDHSIELVVEPMGVASPTGMDGYVPAYLRGTGTVKVEVESQYGRAVTDLEVSTDGSYGLPLAVERGSMFEAMAEGGGVSLSQMLEYQLSSLAQHRVLNGYGAVSAYGPTGTDAIITAEDVEKAYRTSVQAMAAICFRDPDGGMALSSSTDMADLLCAPDGRVTIDLAAVYAQTLMSVVDDIALRWMDYFYMFEVAEGLLEVLFPLTDAIDALLAFVTGEERVSGVPYVKEVMSSNGYSESEYRYPGSGTTTVSSMGFTATVRNPTSDLFSMPWLTDFKKRYEAEGDFVRDAVVGVLKSASVQLAERMDLGVIAVDVDPEDGEAFLHQLMEAFEDAMEDGTGIVEDAIGSSLDGMRVYDEFYGRLADEIQDHASDFVHTGSLSRSIRSSFSAQVAEAQRAAAAEERPYLGPTVDQLMSSPSVSRALESYRSSVYSDLAVFEPLKQVLDGDGGIVKRVMTAIFSHGLEALDIIGPVRDSAHSVVREVLGISGTNPYEGVVTLPGSDGFVLTDDAGNTLTERLSAEIVVEEPTIDIRIDRERSVHTVGFRENPSAAYSTMFVVGIRGYVGYEVTGQGSLAQAMGTSSSVYGSEFLVDATVEIAVATGWELEGVSYQPSCTVLTDLWELLLDVLEPIIEPLRKVLEAIRGALTALGETVMDVAGFLAENLVGLFNILMDPLGELKAMLEDFLEDVVEDAVFGVLMDLNLGDQSISIQFFGCTLTFTTSAITWKANTKTLLTAELELPVAGLTVNAGITAKVRGEVKADNLIITGFGGIEGDDWSVKGKLDPLMKGSRYLITLDGKVGKNEVSLVAPKLDQYHEMGIALSDVPGLGQIIDNIPLPLLGAKVGLDAGFSLKYSHTRDTGLIINEYETNPEGTDRGSEWFEILNNTSKSIDLDGYRVTYGTKARVAETIELGGTVSPGEFLVIEPGFTLVNKTGKWLRLVGPDDEVVDEVNVKADSDNDGCTWQREFDGGTKWVFTDATMGRSNGGPVTGMVVSAADMKDAVWEGVQKAFGKVEHITDVDSLVAFVQYLVRYTLEDLIDTVSAKVIEASVYVSVDLKDATSTMTAGIQVAFRTDGDFVKDVLRYVAGHLESAILGIKNPYRIDPLGMFTENIDLEVLFHAGVGFPEILSDGVDLPRMDLAVLFRANLASLTRLAGADTGSPGMDFGILVRDIPEVAIPSRIPHSKGMDYDLWLFRVEVALA